MKDSGVQWIDEIPKEWSISKVKYLATEKDSLFIDGDWIESDVITETGIRYLTTGNVGPGFYKEQGAGYISYDTFKKLNCLKVYPNDLMISRLNEPIGRACIVPETESFYVVAVDNVILRPNNEYNKKYIMYCMNTEGYSEAGKEAARGTTMQRVSRTLLGNFYIPIPLSEEQKAIADFLDDKVGKIDGILSDLNKQIDILNKYKKSLITETVTKGLDPNVKMKDSGIDWIGEIPSNWRVTKIKYIATKIGSGKTPKGGSEIYEEQGVTFIRSQNVYDDGLHLEDVKYINDLINKEMKNTQLKYGDILINITGASIGRCCVYNIKDRGNVNQHVSIIRLNSKNINSYVRYFLNSYIGKLQVNINQVGGNRESLTFEQLGLFTILNPPLEEQKQIVDYLDKKCSEIDSAISDKQKQIETMEKLKKSLIYEYVTGKKRVGGELKCQEISLESEKTFSSIL